MSLLFIDSFDHYDTTTGEDKYESFSGAIVTGRHGNGIFQPGTFKGLTVTSARCIAGFAFQGTGTLFIVYQESNNINRVSLIVGNLGSISATSEGGAVVFGQTDTGVVNPSTWNYIEIDVTLHASAGTCDIYLNGLLVSSETGLNTLAEGLVSGYGWSGIRLGRLNPAVTIDDFYVLDGSGSAPWNAPLGDIEILVRRPDGQPSAGDNAEWTPSPAVPNWHNVDDINPDDDITYNYAELADVGAKDVMHVEDIGDADEIIGAQLLINGKRTDDGFARIQGIAKQSGTEYLTDEAALTADYIYSVRKVYETAPDGTAWTAEKFNDMQFGYTRTF